MTGLSPSLAILNRMLEDANGVYVPGAVLAKALRIPLMSLGNFIRALRRERPEIAIEGLRGAGYRLFTPTPDMPEPPRKPRSGGGRLYRAGAIVPSGMEAAATLSMLDLMPPATAEIVKQVALESRETSIETLARLVAYGCEVHRDLVAMGENPVGLRRVA